MDIFETFVTKPDELDEHFQIIQAQGIPEKFTKEFLNSIGFKKPNSVLYVKLFKILGLIDEEEQPNHSRYSKFIESNSQSQLIIAELVSKSYAEIFNIDTHAHKLPDEKLFSLFRQRMGKEKSETIVKLVANTFKALADYADWNNFRKSDQNLKSMTTNKTAENEDTSTEEANSPHEEFIVELLNDEVAHDYPSNGASSKNGNLTKERVEKETGETEAKTTKQFEEINDSRSENDVQEDITKSEVEEHSIFLGKALVRRAELLDNMNRHEEAIEAYDDIINYSSEKKYPLGKENITNAYYKKASMLEKLDKSEKALDAYNNFIQRFG